MDFYAIIADQEKSGEISARQEGITIPMYCEANVPITAKLLKKYKEIKELDDELHKKRADFDIRMRRAEKRRKEVKKKENMLMNSIHDFEPFIEESELKKGKAESKFSIENEIVLEVQKELNKLKEVRDALRLKKEALEKQIRTYLPAKLFLEKVAEKSVQFEDVNGIITFYDTLVSLNQELTEKENRDLTFIDNERERLAEYKTENGNKILAVTNQLYELQQEKEKTYNEALSAEVRYSDIKSANSKSAMALAQLTMAISSMYMTICKFEKAEPKEQNPLQQITKVYEFIEDWSEVIPEVKKFLEQKSND